MQRPQAVAELIPPRRDESLTDDGVPTIRFAEYLERLARDVNNVVNESGELSSLSADLSRQNGLISRLSSRVDDLEIADDTDILNSRIANVNAKVTRLIEELLEEVKKLRDVELENKALSVQTQIREEMELLNARFEETFETDIDKDDL